MTDSIEKVQPMLAEQYRQTLERLKLKQVCLEEVHVTYDRDTIKQGKVNINIEHKTYSRQTPEEFFAYITYYLKGVYQKKTALKVEVRYCLIHDIDEPVDQGFFTVFRSLNLKMTTFPYLRELVASITGRMEIKTLTLPYNLFIPDDDKTE